MKWLIESPSKRYKLAVHNHLVLGMDKRNACRKAGLSGQNAKQVFGLQKVKDAIARFKLMEKDIDPQKKELIDFYRSVINGNDLEVVAVVTKYRPVRQVGDPVEPKMVIDGREKVKKKITTADRIAAAKELSVLLGIREEKTKLSGEQDLINALVKRRDELAGAANGEESTEESV